MKESTIYSIGHGNKTVEEFIEELKSFDIEYLLDIRSSPYSKWSTQFNKAMIRHSLEESGIRYVYSGDTLGGLPSDRSCYDSEGKIVYDLIKKKDFFKAGLDRLIVANNKGIRLAIMCSESKPEECHRTKLIGQELLKHNISLKHIISLGKTKSQEVVMYEITKGNNPVDLFGNTISFKSDKSY